MVSSFLRFGKRYEINLGVIFYQWPKLGLGLDVEAEIQILSILGVVMTIFAMTHLSLGLLTHLGNREDEKGCFQFTTWAWSRFPIFSTYWGIVIGTGITQFALHWWVWPVFLGSWPFGPIPSTDYNDKSAERFCEKTHFQVAFGFLVIDMIIGLIVIFSWFWKLFKWCGLCCCCCCCAHCLGINYYVNFLGEFHIK